MTEPLKLKITDLDHVPSVPHELWCFRRHTQLYPEQVSAFGYDFDRSEAVRDPETLKVCGWMYRNPLTHITIQVLD